MMLERPKLDKLFTFGEGQLKPCLMEVRKGKFPFLPCTKIKKGTLVRRLVPIETPKQLEHNENKDINEALKKGKITRALSVNEGNQMNFFTTKEGL